MAEPTVQNLLADLWGDEPADIRPHSPTVRPAEKPVMLGFSPHSPVSPPAASATPAPGDFRPLSEPQLASLITKTAIATGLAPLDLWRFLSADDIAALASGDPVEHRALRAFADSCHRTGDRTPGGHSLPFPGKR